jgi:diketogulonate reductase-like aldo/keto reductase
MENQLIQANNVGVDHLCRTLQLEYIDLYLIHWPITVKPGKGGWPFAEEDLMPMDFKSVWAAMEKCQRLGLAKFIGVSNFSCKKLQNLLSSSTIPPAINQVSPVLQQLQLFILTNNI